MFIMAIAASEPPKESDRYLHENFCWWCIIPEKPKQAPTIDPQKIESLPTSGIYLFEDIEKIVLPTMYEINMNERVTSMTGTVAKPSSPSVKLTAFDAPIITNNPNGIKNIPMSKIKF